MDLFSRKVISWHISAKPDAELVISTFKKAYEKRNAPYGLMFHSDRGTQYTAFSFRQLLDSLNVVQSFSKRDILLTMHVANVSSNILKKKKQTAEPITHYSNCSSLFLNTSRGITIPEDLMVLLVCLLRMKQKLYTGSRPRQLSQINSC